MKQQRLFPIDSVVAAGRLKRSEWAELVDLAKAAKLTNSGYVSFVLRHWLNQHHNKLLQEAGPKPIGFKSWGRKTQREWARKNSLKKGVGSAKTHNNNHV